MGVWPLEGVDHWRVWPLGVWPLEGGHWVCGPLEGVALEVWTIRGVAIGCVAIGEDVDNWRVWTIGGCGHWTVAPSNLCLLFIFLLPRLYGHASSHEAHARTSGHL